MGRVRKRGKTWEVEIRKKGKVVYFSSGFKTKREAEAHDREMEVLLTANVDYKLSHKMKLSDLFLMWLDVDILSQSLQEQTKKRYMKRHGTIVEYFGDAKIGEIVRSDYQRFLNWYGESYEVNEVGRMHANIQKAVEFARADKMLIDDTFLLAIRLNSTKLPKEECLKFLNSRSDYDKVIDYLELFMDYRKSVVDFIIYLMFKVGFRPAGAICVNWDNVDFELQEIWTKNRWNSIQKKLSPPKNDYYYYRKRNKLNPSVRKVPFDLPTKAMLVKLKKQQETVCRLLGVQNENNFVFFQAGAKWALPDESTVNKRVKKIIKELDIEPVITAYGCRHTYGSIKVQEGVPLEVLAKWFGHKDTSMLRTVYIHLMDETRDEWSEREKTLGGKLGGNL